MRQHPFRFVYLHRVECKGYFLHLSMCCSGWILTPHLTGCAILCMEHAWQPQACLRKALMPVAGDLCAWGLVVDYVWS